MVRILGCNSGDPAFGSVVGFLCCLRQALKPLCVYVSGDNRPFFSLSFVLALSSLEYGLLCSFQACLDVILTWQEQPVTCSCVSLETASCFCLLSHQVVLSFELQVSSFLWLFLPVSKIFKERTVSHFSVIYLSCPVTRVWLCLSFRSYVWDRS